MQDLVVTQSWCRYLCLVGNKWFCGLDLLSSQLWVKAPRGGVRFDREIFEKIPQIDPDNCTPQKCRLYIAGESFIPRLIEEKKEKRAYRLV